jgi:predicted O-linked N-acetylglucosamine transferase (SPINDLY family)
MTADDPIALARRIVDLGNELEAQGDFDAALARYREATAAAPTYARAYINIGNALQRQGKLDEAIFAHQTALDVDPRFAPARFNLGNLYLAQGKLDAAERELREALRLAPEMVNAAIALADVCESGGRPADAERELRYALRIDPRHPGAANNLRLLLNQQGRWDEAEEASLQAVAMDPTSASACAGLARQYLQSGRAKDAEEMCRRALAADPQSSRTHSELLFSLNLRDDLDTATVFREHLAFAAAFERGEARSDVAMPAAGDPDRRLKVGYLSGDFRQHPVALFLRPVLKHHDRTRVEVFCYSNNDVNDELTGELTAHADHWRDIAGADDAAAARIIRSDGIDILVDLAGHTPQSRLLLLPRRCAAVQATWLGYLNTSGLESADFRICDRHTDPPGASEHLHSERLYRMPNSQWCYAPVYDVPPVEPPHPGEPERVIFGSFNQFPKISEAGLDLWCEVLRRAPHAELQVLGVPQGKAATRFLAGLARRGVGADRVTLHPRLGIADYFSAIGHVDIAFDTFPYNGATTTLDTLWMGVPLVALIGDRGIARGGFSILETLGLPELIASTNTDFVDRNLRLVNDIGRRHELRRTLRQRLERSPLMDAAGFTRALENGYREMWRAVRRM